MVWSVDGKVVDRLNNASAVPNEPMAIQIILRTAQTASRGPASQVGGMDFNVLEHWMVVSDSTSSSRPPQVWIESLSYVAPL